MEKYSFLVPENCCGRFVRLPGIRGEDKPIVTWVPRNAMYMNVNTLEDEEEFGGCQSWSDRNQLCFLDSSGSWLYTRDIDNVLNQWLMPRLEKVFVRLY
ncbi:MAG: hypothetical protein KKE05_03345 [Nanoarchaeota archaeon]|nr:hypothetical protein [Nanoarchaeota archaeon]